MIRKIYRHIYKLVISRIKPVNYARKLGVNIPKNGDIFIYGHVSYGTEPWLITLGNRCHITDGVKFETHDGGTLIFRTEIPDLEITKPIKIGDDCYIGNNAIILPGVTIGNRCVIGAGAVVSRNIPDNSVAVGVPARVIKTADEYLEKLKKESIHLGHLQGQEKDRALMNYYNYTGSSKGIYF